MKKKQKKKRLLRGILVCLCLFLCSCVDGKPSRQEETTEERNLEEEEYSQELFAMDTYMTLTAYGENSKKAVKDSIEEIQRLEKLWSVTEEKGEIGQINQNGKGQISQDTIAIVEKAQEISKSTEGAFDMTIYPLMELWGFTTGSYHVPKEEQIFEKLSLVNTEHVKLDKEKQTITLEEGQKIDLGGIAKGYTSGKVIENWKEKGISSGIVSLGGNVQVLGTKPDGSLWKIGIKDPEDKEGNLLGVLSVSDCAVITSGGYERYFEENGEAYHHILDTNTGKPADNGLVSVTIVSSDGALADGLSTALFVMGKDKAVEFWRKHKQEFETVLVEENGEIWVTEGLEEKIEMEQEFHVVRADK